MIQRRDFWTVFLLSIITCGIYSYYWVYQTTKNINTMAGDDGSFVDPALAVILTLFTCGIYPLWWYYKLGNRMQNMGAANSIRVEESGSIYLLWMLFGILICGIGPLIAMYLFIKNVNLLTDAYNAATYAG